MFYPGPVEERTPDAVGVARMRQPEPKALLISSSSIGVICPLQGSASRDDESRTWRAARSVYRDRAERPCRSEDQTRPRCGWQAWCRPFCRRGVGHVGCGQRRGDRSAVRHTALDSGGVTVDDAVLPSSAVSTYGPPSSITPRVYRVALGLITPRQR
jgi:hypothetical protein